MTRLGLIFFAIFCFCAYAFGAGQISVMDPITKLPKYLKGGVGIDISTNGTLAATGVAVPISIQPWSNISTASRGNTAPYALVATFKSYTTVDRATTAQLADGLSQKSPLFANYTTLARFGAGPTYNGLPISAGGVAGVATFNARAGNVLPQANDYSIGQISGAATVASTGSYNDLSNKPSLALVATSGSYLDLTNKPSLSTVATTGAYSDLTGKPGLAAVATSGSYTDLLNKPANYTLPTATTTVLGGVKVDGTSVVIDGAGVISSTVSAGVSSVDGSTGAVSLSGTYKSISAFNSYSTAKGAKDAAQDAAIAAKEPADSTIIKESELSSSTTSTSITTAANSAAVKSVADGLALKADTSSLGTAAYTASNAYATAAQGVKADDAKPLYHVSKSGAVGDGVTDDKALIQAYLNTLPAGATLEWDGTKSYYLATALSYKGTVNMKGNGATITAPSGFLNTPWRTNNTGQSVVITQGVRTFTIPAGITVNVGDFVQIWDTTPYMTGYNKGLFAEIVDVSGSVATMDTAARASFTGTNFVTITGLKNVEVQGFRIGVGAGTSTQSVTLIGNNLHIHNMDLIGSDNAFLGLSVTANKADVHHIFASGYKDVTGTRIGYGITAVGDNIDVHNCILLNNKHNFAASTNRNVLSGVITFRNSYAYQDPSIAGTQDTHGYDIWWAPVDAHGDLDLFVVKNNTILYSAAAAVTVRNGKGVIEGNAITQLSATVHPQWGGSSNYVIYNGETTSTNISLYGNTVTLLSGTELLHTDTSAVSFAGNKFVNVTFRGATIKDTILQAATSPSSGTWAVGDLVYNSNQTAGSVEKWRCVVAGMPGTWEAIYPSSAAFGNAAYKGVTGTGANAATATGTPSDGCAQWTSGDLVSTGIACGSGTTTTPSGASGDIQYNNGGSFGGLTTLHFDSTNSRYGIGTASPAYSNDLNTPSATEVVGTRIQRTAGDLSAGSRYTGLQVVHTPSAASPHASASSSGVDVLSYYSGAGTLGTLYGLYVSGRNTSSTGGTITQLSTLRAEGQAVTNGTIAQLRTIDVGDAVKGASAAITTQYGIYIANQTKGATNYSIYTGTGKAYFGDNVGIGTTSPAQKLDVAGNIKVSGYIIPAYVEQTASYTVGNDSSRITLASGTATATLPASVDAGDVSVVVTVAGAAASGVSFAAGSGGSISWGDAGTPTFTNSKTADVVCHTQNTAATTTAAWRCVKGGNF